MTSREIIAKTISLEKTPRLPVSLLSAGAWTFNRKGLTLEQVLHEDPKKLSDIIVETNEIAGCDIVWPGSGYHNLAIKAIGGKIKFRSKGTADVQETLIGEISDIEGLDAGRVKDDGWIRLLAEMAGNVQAAIGDSVMVGTSQWAPFTLAGLLYGIEKLMRNIYKDKQALHAVLEFAADLCYKYLEVFLDSGAVSLVSLADPSSSGDMISREQFREFSLPYLKKLVGKLRARGVYVLIHICGNTTNRLDLIPETGANIMSVDYKVSLAKARELLGGKIAFAGQMNPVSVMQASDKEGVEEACRNCIEQAGNSPGYILMPGCDIPPSVPMENVYAMVRTGRNYPAA
ncbi:MAG: uroporphyrinogen decarboxylase family protein [Brevinematales bacterium]|jgi:uroporphyrinogen decarboxylase